MNQEERLSTKQEAKILNQVVMKKCDQREQEVLRLEHEVDLTLLEISFFIETKKKKNLIFGESVAMDFFLDELTKHSRPFEKRIWDSLDSKVTEHLSAGISLSESQINDLVEWLDICFRKSGCFTEEELDDLWLTRSQIREILKKKYEMLSDYEMLKLNLMALSRIYPKKYVCRNTKKKRAPVKGVMSTVSVFQIKKRALNKLKGSRELRDQWEG